jgi:hypothetical protein
MTTLSELWWRCNDGDPAACDQLGAFLRDLLESMYLARYFNPSIPPIPQPGPYLNFEPTPTPMTELLANQQFLINQLVLNALGDPSPQPSVFAYTRENQLHLDVAKQLLTRFERAADEMRQIVETERTNKQLTKEKKS